MHKLPTQFCQLVTFLVVKRRHGKFRPAAFGNALNLFRSEISVIIYANPMLEKTVNLLLLAF